MVWYEIPIISYDSWLLCYAMVYVIKDMIILAAAVIAPEHFKHPLTLKTFQPIMINISEDLKLKSLSWLIKISQRSRSLECLCVHEFSYHFCLRRHIVFYACSRYSYDILNYNPVAPTWEELWSSYPPFFFFTKCMFLLFL